MQNQVRAGSSQKIRVGFTLASLTHAAGQNVVTLRTVRALPIGVIFIWGYRLDAGDLLESKRQELLNAGN